jgi:hypothetical protein
MLGYAVLLHRGSTWLAATLERLDAVRLHGQREVEDSLP